MAVATATALEMKIRTAIFGTYAVASAVGLAVLMRFVLAEVRPRYVSSLERTMQESADLVAAALATRPRQDWPATFDRLSTVPTGMRLEIEDAGGTILFDSRPQLAQQVQEEYSSKRFRSAKDDVSYLIDRHRYVDDGWLRVAAAINDDTGSRGQVVLSRPLRTVNAFIWEERKKLAGGAALVALVMLGLGWWLANKLTGSLERLAAYATAVRDGRKARPPASRASEIAAVGEAFEGMRRTLEGKDYIEHYTHSLAHELKAPLSGIRGSAELLQEQAMGEADRKKFLGNLRAEADRIHGIVDRMLRLTALEAQGGLESRENMRLADVVNEVVRTLEPDAQLRSVTLLADPGEAGELMVSGERFLIVQAVTNLVQNAIGFSPAGSTVTIGLRRSGAAAVGVEVCDEGPDVPDFAREKVFDRFYSLPRPDGGRKSTGLDLSFVREIAHLHGGEAGLENRSPVGARAWLQLPLATET